MEESTRIFQTIDTDNNGVLVISELKPVIISVIKRLSDIAEDYEYLKNKEEQIKLGKGNLVQSGRVKGRTNRFRVINEETHN